MDRRTACLHQANAFREKAIADPEHHDQWIDEAIKWLERAMEASCRAAITVEADDTHMFRSSLAQWQMIPSPHARA
ncbi:hypothetical protein AC629_26250 [Bradyrhizobium sp. NAS80.1]|uniref:hypothetical protein n=1 Tax=Bradyrhizobium sp. NAS80.1 TaxID=1680159 RepID=UPI000969E3BF|nr:hypothetical protein [Bradyrhizobium sp. NAS80.1]OKO80979.1 hypothetical protein AC629_26250 [Bradyrhizobium sp. NAS80.1]